MMLKIWAKILCYETKGMHSIVHEEFSVIRLTLF